MKYKMGKPLAALLTASILFSSGASIYAEAEIVPTAEAEKKIPEVSVTPEAEKPTEADKENEQEKKEEVSKEETSSEEKTAPSEPVKTEEEETPESDASEEETAAGEKSEVPTVTETPKVTEAPEQTESKPADKEDKKEKAVETAVPAAETAEAEGPDTTPVDNSTVLADGEYTPDAFTFSGGSGKVKIQCGKVIVASGKASAVIQFTSEKYTELKANGTKYAGKCGGGVSEYTIPIQLGADNTIVGKTTAMSKVNWVSYVIHAEVSEKGLISGAPETPTPTPVPDTSYEDGDYNISIESGYKMFEIASSSAKVVDGKIIVTIVTGNTSYDKIYLGNKEDDPKEPVIQGVLKEDGSGYVMSFELDKTMMGQTINFVPGKADGSWYVKNQYTLTIPASMDKIEDKKDEDKKDDPKEDEKPSTSYDNGNYYVDVESSASMFKVEKCVLNVKDGKYTADITLSGTGYDYLFMGTAAQAGKADKSQYIGFKNENGKYVYTIPVEAFDTPVAVAAHSKKNNKWYDRTLTFKSATMEKVVPTVKDGDYTIDVTTSTGKMFNVIAAVLTNKNGVMTAKITLSGSGYDYLYLGSVEDAPKQKQKWIKYTLNVSNQYVFEIPVESLDKEIKLAAHSSKNDAWYERGIIFESSTMKVTGTSGVSTPTPTPTPTQKPTNDKKPDKESKYESDLSGGTGAVDSSTGLADGVYTPDKFSWSGGSGRTSISCSKVTVTGGQAYATIVFSSSNYGYVKANGNIYYPSYGAGTSSFTIPVKLNANNTIIGMTTAMSAAHEITYSIFVYIAGADKAVSDSSELSKNDSLSEKAPEIAGLEYVDEEKIEHAKFFKIYHYDQDVSLIEVDLATGTDRPETAETTEEDETVSEEAELTEESAVSEEETEETKDAATIISDLYKNKVIKYLIVPEDAEIPVGLEKEVIVVNVPVENIYTDSKEATDFLKKMEKEDLITLEGEEGTKPEYKDMILKKTDLAILTDAFLWDEDKEMSMDEQTELFYEITERLTTLNIPALIDRSADEESEEASAEWLKVYEEIIG